MRHMQGMGFLEFEKHDHAVACLRQLNNNPNAFTHDRRPIIEFAIDNVKVSLGIEPRGYAPALTQAKSC